MSSSVAKDPSPIKSVFVHGSASVAAFSMAFGAAAIAITVFGSERAAGPNVQLALFSADQDGDPTLNPRLRGQDRSLVMANVQLGSAIDTSDSEPSLGIDYSNGASIKPTAPDVARVPTGTSIVRINGRAVLPGQSLSEVRAQDAERVAALSVTQAQSAQIDQNTPFAKYSIPFDNPQSKPTVSIIVGGLGINRTRTLAAIDGLPKEVTLSFAPTTSNLSAWIRRARQAGHEVVLEMPMEPYDYGRARPHANMLRVSADAATNQRKLNAELSRATGYMGVINFQGDRFVTDLNAATPLVETLTEKGVALFQDGGLQTSVLPDLAKSQQIHFGAAISTIDARPEADEIEKQLLLLEAEALDSGASLGTAMPFPITVDLLSAWIDRLDDKGIVLAPASYYAQQTTTTGQFEVAELDPRG